MPDNLDPKRQVSRLYGNALILKNESGTLSIMGMQVNLTRFRRSVELMRQVPGKHGPEVLNKSVAKICIGSKGSKGLVHLTKRTTRERIQEDMSRQVTSVSKSGRASKPTPMIILLAASQAVKAGIRPTKTGIGKRFGKNHGDKLWRAVVKARAKRILAARLRSRAATVAGWLHAMEKLKKATEIAGAATSNGVLKMYKGSASKSFPRVATARSLIAGLTNLTDDSGVVCPPSVLQMAINEATRDNVDYLKRKFGAGIRDAVNGTNIANNI